MHNNCTGEQENASRSAVQEMIATLARANPSISGPAITKTLKDGSGISVHPRTALRAKAKALGRTGSSSTEGFAVLTSLLEQLDASDKYTHTSIEARKKELPTIQSNTWHLHFVIVIVCVLTEVCRGSAIYFYPSCRRSDLTL